MAATAQKPTGEKCDEKAFRILPKEFSIRGSKTVLVYLNRASLVTIDLCLEIEFQPKRLILREKDWEQFWALQRKVDRFLRGETTGTEEWWLTQRNSTAGIKVTLKHYLGTAIVDIRYVWRPVEKDGQPSDTWHFTKHGISMALPSWGNLVDKKESIDAAIQELKAVKPYADSMFTHIASELIKFQASKGCYFNIERNFDDALAQIDRMKIISEFRFRYRDCPIDSLDLFRACLSDTRAVHAWFSKMLDKSYSTAYPKSAEDF